MYESGLSTRAIANHFHVSHVTICLKLKGWGVALRGPGRAKK
jgi:transcriptional regulator of aromatic amino acid metabolism